jgi:hypothetical protein
MVGSVEVRLYCKREVTGSIARIAKAVDMLVEMFSSSLWTDIFFLQEYSITRKVRWLSLC